jgi:hypothetical protein
MSPLLAGGVSLRRVSGAAGGSLARAFPSPLGASRRAKPGSGDPSQRLSGRTVASVLVLCSVVLVAAGCKGDEKSGEPAAQALRDYLLAAPAGNKHLSERVPQGVTIPEADEFLVLSDGEWNVAAVELESPFGAYAAPLREEDGEWQVKLPTEQLRIVEGPPDPGSPVGDDQRVGFAVYSSAPDLESTLWIDGEKETLQGAGGPQFTRYWAVPDGLGLGSHLAVAFARGDGGATAVAWTFTVG